MGAQIGQTMSRLGVHQGLAPVLDVARDLRWGRTEETIGEDPYLVGTIGSAYVRGLESAGHRLHAEALCRLFLVAGSAATWRPFPSAGASSADVMLPPFEMALRAGARSVMNSYTNIDGLPVAADDVLLTDLLRDSVRLHRHRCFRLLLGAVPADPPWRGRLGRRGRGPGPGGRDRCRAPDGQLLRRGLGGGGRLRAGRMQPWSTAPLDASWLRRLRSGCSAPTGHRTRPCSRAQDAELDSPDCRSLARELAERSIVLLANDGTLPLNARFARSPWSGPGRPSQARCWVATPSRCTSAPVTRVPPWASMCRRCSKF